MNELISITTNEVGEPTVLGRELHEFLGVTTRYNDWFPRMAEYGFTEGKDFYSFLSKTSETGGRPSTDHLLTIDMAKELAMIGQNRFFETLRQDGFLIKRKGSDYNMPTQKAMELGLFEIKETAITSPDGKVHVRRTPKVTGKGQIYFVNRYCGGFKEEIA